MNVDQQVILELIEDLVQELKTRKEKKPTNILFVNVLGKLDGRPAKTKEW